MITLKNEVLREALRRLAMVGDSKGEVESFQTILVSTRQGAIDLSLRNRFASAKLVVPVENMVACPAFGVTCQLLLRLTEALPDGDVSLDISDKYVMIQGAQNSFSLTRVSDEVLSRPYDYDKVPFVATCIKDAVRDLQAVRYAVAKGDATRPEYATVCIDPQTVAGTDGFRLSVFPNTALQMTGRVLLTNHATDLLTRFFRGADKGFWHTDGSELHISDGLAFLSIRTGAGEYPQYSQVVPAPSKARVVIARDMLVPALSRLRLFDKNCLVKFTFQQNRLVLTARADVGSGQETIPIEGEVIESMLMNATFVAEAAAAVGPQLVLELTGREAMVVTDPERRHINVILPCHEPG